MPGTCACGDHTVHIPVIDFVKRVWHTVEDCTPFPQWTEHYTDEEVKEMGPWGYGINKMGFFAKTDHPEDCPCGGARGYGVSKVGSVCFIGCHGTYAHLEALPLDWEKQRYLALAPKREIKELLRYPQSDRCEGLPGSLTWPDKKT